MATRSTAHPPPAAFLALGAARRSPLPGDGLARAQSRPVRLAAQARWRSGAAAAEARRWGERTGERAARPGGCWGNRGAPAWREGGGALPGCLRRRPRPSPPSPRGGQGRDPAGHWRLGRSPGPAAGPRRDGNGSSAGAAQPVRLPLGSVVGTGNGHSCQSWSPSAFASLKWGPIMPLRAEKKYVSVCVKWEAFAL